MRIISAFWTPQVNMLVIQCDECFRAGIYRADRWRVVCGYCGRNEGLGEIRERYLDERR